MTAPEYALATPEFDNVRRDVHRRFEAHVAADKIDQMLDACIAQESSEARIQAFLPTIVEREVSEQLTNMLIAEGIKAASRTEVLFVSECNADRYELA